MPADAFRPKAFCKIIGEPGGETSITDIAYADGSLALWKTDGKPVAAFSGLPDAVWSFTVSGYRVLPRWIDGRKGRPLTLALMRELRDVAARIHELIHWFGQADLVLGATLADSLTRDKLGFPAPVPDVTDTNDD